MGLGTSYTTLLEPSHLQALQNNAEQNNELV